MEKYGLNELQWIKIDGIMGCDFRMRTADDQNIRYIWRCTVCGVVMGIPVKGRYLPCQKKLAALYRDFLESREGLR